MAFLSKNLDEKDIKKLQQSDLIDQTNINEQNQKLLNNVQGYYPAIFSLGTYIKAIPRTNQTTTTIYPGEQRAGSTLYVCNNHGFSDTSRILTGTWTAMGGYKAEGTLFSRTS